MPMGTQIRYIGHFTIKDKTTELTQTFTLKAVGLMITKYITNWFEHVEHKNSLRH